MECFRVSGASRNCVGKTYTASKLRAQEMLAFNNQTCFYRANYKKIIR